MAPSKTLIYKQVPKGLPVAGKDLAVETREIDIENAPKGGLVVEVIYASFDPYLRGKMRDPKVKSYSPPFIPDEPIYNGTVSKVIKSDTPAFKEGDIIRAMTSIGEYALVTDLQGQRAMKVDNPYNLDLALFTGALGMPGLTAWSSLYKIGKPKKGETIFVSSAAGAVGQIVGQVAKREGLTVIGSVGSDEKLDFITKELGYDSGFNYKKEKPGDALKRLAPNGIDIYYENVGGEHLEAALDSLNVLGRIVTCGMISKYNSAGEPDTGIRNLMYVVSKQLTMQGFLVANPEFGPAYYKEHQETLQKWLSDGSVKAKHSFTEGIDNAAEGLVGIFEGKNFGKAVLRIKKE